MTFIPLQEFSDNDKKQTSSLKSLIIERSIENGKNQ
jgi:hypothetical protein